MLNQRSRLQGFSLLELSIASGILSVGTLAVLTLFLHWRALPDAQDIRYQALQQTMLDRPAPYYSRQFELFECEREKE